MAKNEKYDWGIFRGVSMNYDYKDKETNTYNTINYMIDRSLLMFKYTNLPETIPAKELERLLQTAGFAGITKVKGELYAFTGGLGGEPDEYYRPTQLIVSNPSLKYSKSLTLGKDVVLVRNDFAMMGLIPIYSKYGKLMSENEITMVLSNINKRNNNLISATDDNTGESAKKYLKDLEEGKLGYIMENKLFDSLNTHSLANAPSIMTELIEYQQYLKASMYNEIGINANGNMKRERLITDEIQVNNEALYPLIDNMLDCRREALLEINEMFDIDISVELNSSWDTYRQDGDTDTNEQTSSESETDIGVADLERYTDSLGEEGINTLGDIPELDEGAVTDPDELIPDERPVELEEEETETIEEDNEDAKTEERDTGIEREDTRDEGDAREHSEDNEVTEEGDSSITEEGDEEGDREDKDGSTDTKEEGRQEVNVVVNLDINTLEDEVEVEVEEVSTELIEGQLPIDIPELPLEESLEDIEVTDLDEEEED